MSDLISRQSLLNNLERYRELFSWDDGDRERAILSRVIKELQSMPSAPRWIPVSERLPEARRSVILSTKDWSGEGCYWETTVHHVIWKGYRWNATYWDDEVIAWMPLPEAWRGEEDKSV